MSPESPLLPPASAFGAVLAQMADGVIVADAAGRITYVNDAAHRLHGGAAVGVAIDTWSAAYRLYTLDGAPHPPHALPLARAVGGEAVTDARWRVRRPDGTEIVAQGSATPLRGPGGAPAGAVLVLRDVTAEHEARVAADAANQAKSHFLATTSHEIRTPINAIIGYTELMELGIPGPLTEQQREYLERVRLSSRHLLSVVNQVLDLSKIEAGRMIVRVRPARAGDVAAAAAALVEPQAQGRGVVLTVACARDPAGVAYFGDPDRVEQVVVNLLSNAVKFTEPGGSVTLTCGLARFPSPDAVVEPHERGWAYFRVEDTGVGIPADQLEAVFEPFVQAEQGHTRAHGGTGLGLPIARRLARMMGGDVTARSASGDGSTFFVWLPAARPEDVPTGAGPAADRRGRSRYARGLSVVADATLEEIEHVLSGYAARLRTDPGTPSARAMSEADLEDHTATFLADMAQALAAIEAARGAPSANLRDGTLIQRVIAERHGTQRARLGWGEAEVRREFQVLREELAAAVRRRVREAADVEVGEALLLFGRFLDHAEAASRRTLAAGSLRGA